MHEYFPYGPYLYAFLVSSAVVTFVKVFRSVDEFNASLMTHNHRSLFIYIMHENMLDDMVNCNR